MALVFSIKTFQMITALLIRNVVKNRKAIYHSWHSVSMALDFKYDVISPTKNLPHKPPLPDFHVYLNYLPLLKRCGFYSGSLIMPINFKMICTPCMKFGFAIMLAITLFFNKNQ